MYDPTTGRWITCDPIGAAGADPNLYQYVRNNPTNLTDPSGHQAQHPNYEYYTKWKAITNAVKGPFEVAGGDIVGQYWIDASTTRRLLVEPPKASAFVYTPEIGRP
jgi:uncharacterized protein RhaS with RHS repeats